MLVVVAVAVELVAVIAASAIELVVLSGGHWHLPCWPCWRCWLPVKAMAVFDAAELRDWFSDWAA